MAKVKQTKSINPFGRLHNYISVSFPHNATDLGSNESSYMLEISNGTTTFKIKELRIGLSSNFSKPFVLFFKGGNMMITYKQLKLVLSSMKKLYASIEHR